MRGKPRQDPNCLVQPRDRKPAEAKKSLIKILARPPKNSWQRNTISFGTQGQLKQILWRLRRAKAWRKTIGHSIGGLECKKGGGGGERVGDSTKIVSVRSSSTERRQCDAAGGKFGVRKNLNGVKSSHLKKEEVKGDKCSISARKGIRRANRGTKRLNVVILGRGSAGLRARQPSAKRGGVPELQPGNFTVGLGLTLAPEQSPTGGTAGGKSAQEVVPAK